MEEVLQGKVTVKAVEIAIGYIGQQEVPKGSNWGPFVEKCLRNVGITFAAPWCMAFVHTCYKEAALALGVVNPVVKTGGVLDCWNRTAVNFKLTKAECLRHPELILPGAQFFLKEGATVGHTGIVERVEGHLLHTIEGNTNDTGSREGFEVCRKVRDMNGAMFLGVVIY